MAIAYFITFMTYGTWLHGTSKDEGSVDRDHNQYSADKVATDAQREDDAREHKTHTPYAMHSAEMRQVVCDAIVALCREKGWHLLAAHVRTNHVHVVVSVDHHPGRVMSDMKARASRVLNRVEGARAEGAAHGAVLREVNGEWVGAPFTALPPFRLLHEYTSCAAFSFGGLGWGSACDRLPPHTALPLATAYYVSTLRARLFMQVHFERGTQVD